MLKKLRNLLSTSVFKPLNIPTGMKNSPTQTSAERYCRIQEANKIKSKLADFIGSNAEKYEVVSLGENCSSAWYIKQIGLKYASYPFDWVFSSPEIILDCINDKFEKYLDKRLIVPKRDNASAGHSYYHDNLFNHRNPLASEKDYNYIKRCCNRFIDLLESQDNYCYLITLINESEKRPGWAKGFTKHFSMPQNQSVETVVKLFKNLKNSNKHSKFVVVDHYTNSNRASIAKKISDDVFLIEFHADGSSTGVFYENELDDFCIKLSLTGLYGVSKNS